MWKVWKPNHSYTVPEKPATLDEQMSEVWDALFNHWPGLMQRQQERLDWYDVKMRFQLALLAVIVGFLAVQVFV